MKKRALVTGGSGTIGAAPVAGIRVAGIRGVRVKHVLVVDDDPTMRDVVGSYLENNNFRVSFAADGQAMNRVLTNQPVDLMILDLKLTDEDGLELMQDMVRRPTFPSSY